MKRSKTPAIALALLLGASGAAVAGDPDERGGNSFRDSESFKEGQLSALYMMDPSLHRATIDAELVGDTMHLRGHVVSESDRMLAERLAGAIAGVDRVENRLTVRAAAAATVASAVPAVSFRQHVADATSEHRVRAELERAGYGKDITVIANGGIVTLAGAVETEGARSGAAQLAEQLPAVNRVVNRLEVDAQGQVHVASDGDGHIGDRWIEAHAWTALDKAKGLDGERIRVKAERGRVALIGTVDNASDRERAVELSKRIRGVVDVDASRLQVAMGDAEQGE